MLKSASSRLLGAETILLVEDEDGVRESAAEYLRENGYTVLTAKGGPEALQIAEQYDKPIHLLLTDLIMPVNERARTVGEDSACSAGSPRGIYVGVFE